MEVGGDLEEKNKAGKTPLQVASSVGNKEMVKVLLNNNTGLVAIGLILSLWVIIMSPTSLPRCH